MRVNIPFTAFDRDRIPAGTVGEMSGPLFLVADPITPTGAATKQYADSFIANLNMDNITSGKLPTSRLGEFLGDIRNYDGSIMLTPTGVVAGRKVNVIVNHKGLVSSGDNSLSVADIPPLSWNKITTGKPTTLAGYGITAALPILGGTMSGKLSTTHTATLDKHALSKGQVENIVNSVDGGSNIGELMLFPSDQTPHGFLKANGAAVNKTTYAELYAAIGNEFLPSGMSATGLTVFYLPDIPLYESANTGEGIITYIRY